MEVKIDPIENTFAGRVKGIDVTKPLSAAQVTLIEAGMDQHGVLVFPGQPVNDEQQLDFARSFGEIEESKQNHIARGDQTRLAAGIADVSNLDKDGKPLAQDDRRRMFNLGNQLWHSDSSFRAVPAKYSILSGRIVSSDGGNTEFADMRAAYDALDQRTKEEIEDLVCEHSLIYSRGQLGFEMSAEEEALFKPVRQRLVRTHPVTGRKSLFLSSHAGKIEGWQVPEARAFLRELIEHATQREFLYVHQWAPFDLVVWDNRQTMHRVRRFSAETPRDMRRVTVAGDAPTC